MSWKTLEKEFERKRRHEERTEAKRLHAALRKQQESEVKDLTAKPADERSK